MSALERCSRRVENCARYRPGYPKRLIDFLYNEGNFSRESVIADIGSGTGMFSRLLLERGSRVVAIEPDDAMREASERLLCDEFQRFVAIKGTAENTTLSDASVSHIVCAHSFHKFDFEKCKNEFARILKPSGTVNLIWNRRLAECDEFSQEFDRLIQRYSVNNEKKTLKRLTSDEFSIFFGSDSYSVVSLPNQQHLDLEGIKGRLLSDDFLPSQGEDGFNEMMAELESLFERYNQCGRITMRYETEAYAGRFNIA